ncbi:MAG: lamin tail domain-containing protein [Acidimicrobiales bacterium]|nr:lamin tail domain-containing protein [Acidimicrobiales bacterium]
MPRRPLGAVLLAAAGIAAVGACGSAEPTTPTGRPALTLLEVVDGDTLDVRTADGSEDTIRLLGINAPEREDCLGDRATERLTALTDDAALVVESDGRDEFGRLLAYVWADDVLVNLALAAEGLAVTPAVDAHRLEATLTAAAEDARDAGIGLWAPDACGPATAATVRIVGLQADAPGPDEENPNGEWIDLANVGSANEGSTPVDLGGWRLRDESTRHRYEFAPGTVLAPGAVLRVRSGCGEDTTDVVYWCDGDPVWNNGGDTALLQDPNGNVVDQWTTRE